VSAGNQKNFLNKEQKRFSTESSQLLCVGELTAPWSKEFGQFFEWWQTLKRYGHLVPRIRDFDENIPKNLAPAAFLLKRERGGEFRLSEIGEELRANSLKDLRGSHYLSLFSRDQAEEMGEHLFEICGQPCGSDSIRTVCQENGDLVIIRHLLLPMVGEGGVLKFVCGYAKVLDRKLQGNQLLRSNRFEHIAYLDISAGRSK